MKYIFLILVLFLSSCSDDSSSKNGLSPKHQQISYAGIQVVVPKNSRIIPKMVSDISGSVHILSKKNNVFSILQWSMSDGENFEDPEEVKELFKAFFPEDANTKESKSISINDQKGTFLTISAGKDDFHIIMWPCTSGRLIMFMSNSKELVNININKVKSPTRELDINPESSLPPMILPEGMFYTLSNSTTAFISESESNSYAFLLNLSHLDSKNLTQGAQQLVMGLTSLIGVNNLTFSTTEKSTFFNQEVDIKNSTGDIDGEAVFMKSFLLAPEKRKKYYFFTLSYSKENSEKFLAALNSSEFSDYNSNTEVYNQHIENLLKSKDVDEKMKSVNFMKRLQPSQKRIEALVEKVPQISDLDFDQFYSLLQLIPDYKMEKFSSSIFSNINKDQNAIANATLSRLMFINEEYNYKLIKKAFKNNKLNEFNLESFIEEIANEDNDFSLFTPEVLTEFSKLTPQKSYYRLLKTVFLNESSNDELTEKAKEFTRVVLQEKLASLLNEKPQPDSPNYYTYIEVLNLLNDSPKDITLEFLPLLEESTERQAVYYELLLKSRHELVIDEKLIKKASTDDVNFYKLYQDLFYNDNISILPPESLSLNRLIKSQVLSHCEITENRWPLDNFKRNKVTESKEGQIYEFSFSHNDEDFIIISGPHQQSVKNFSLSPYIRLFPVNKDSNKDEMYKTYMEEMKEHFSEE